MLPDIEQRLTGCGATVEQGVVNEASILDAPGLDDGGWPTTPGLLGMWTRIWHRLGSTTASLRAGFASLGGRAGIRDSIAGESVAFGTISASALSETIRQIADDVTPARMALGPVTAAWTSATVGLERQLALLPLDVAAELAAQVNRRTLRRVAGVTCTYIVELLILLVLLVTIFRVGSDFAVGSSPPEGLLGSVVTLVLILLIIGHTVTAAFFPPLRQRLRRTVGQRARGLVKATVKRAQSALQEHVEAVDVLVRQGREMLSQIDHFIMALATENTDTADVNRLFGEQPLRLAANASTQEPAAEALRLKRPAFD